MADPRAPAPGFVDGLLRWFADDARDLPWRRTRDPWRVLVSETMLQQTQVARVVPRYEAFVARWPTPDLCAVAPLADVLRAWEGLGYHRRARDLHACATAVVADHGGAVPDDLDALLALPGVGPYTARAVLAFAFERDVGVLDVNAGRVLARAVAGEALSRREAQELADASVPAGRGWSWNQAVLDLGARVCTKRDPDCAGCAVATACRWAGDGPDPSVGSAGEGRRQSRFEGSDRQGRGRLLDALRGGPVRRGEVHRLTGWDDEARSDRVLAGLVEDGLAEVDGGHVRLPA